MQTQLSGEQLTLATIFCMQPAPTIVAKEVAAEFNEDILAEIEELQGQILELRKEIGNDEEALFNAEEDELDMEPEPGDEDIFDAAAPMLEEDLLQTRYENDAEIRALECEIAELEAKLKHVR